MNEKIVYIPIYKGLSFIHDEKSFRDSLQAYSLKSLSPFILSLIKTARETFKEQNKNFDNYYIVIIKIYYMNERDKINNLDFLGYIDLYGTNPYKRGWDNINPMKKFFNISPSYRI